MKNSRAIKSIIKAKDKWRSRFGSRKVFIVYLICLFVTLATMLASVTMALAAKSISDEKMIEHIFLCVVAIALSNIPVIMRTKFNFQIPSFLQIIITVFIVAHFVLGDIYRLYDHIPGFDKILHMTSGVVIAILGFSVVYGFTQTGSGSVKLPPVFVALFSFCFALALAVLWEVFEYGVDSIFGANMQRWQDGLTEIEVDGIKYFVTGAQQGSGLIDTMTDLIIGTAGAAVVCIVGGILLKKHPDNTKFYIMKVKKPVPQAANVTEGESAGISSEEVGSADMYTGNSETDAGNCENGAGGSDG